MKINLVKHCGVLLPSLDADKDALLTIGDGEIIEAIIKKPRNAGHHRKFFALIQIVVENTDYDNADQVLHLLKLKLGYYDTMINTNGQAVYMAKSISFSKMDQAEFNQFYNQSINVILRDFLTDWTDAKIDQAINQVVRF